MGIYNYIKMISNISEYRQKKVDKLQNTMRKVGELIKAASMLVHTKATDYATADLPSIDKSVLAESPVEMRQKFNTLNSEGKYAEAEAIRQSMVASYNVKVPSYYESMLKTARDTKAPNNKIAGELEKLADSITGNKNLETTRNEILKEYYRLKSDKKEVASPVKTDSSKTASPVKKETASPVKKGTTSPVKKDTTSPTKKEVAKTASPTKKAVTSPTK